MQPYTVLTVPDPRLHKIAAPIEAVTDETRLIFDRMILTMRQEEGVGLAAIQVGIEQRLLVMDIHEHDHHHDHDGPCTGSTLYKMANPKIIWRSETDVVSQEGCLSVPEQYAEVVRSEKIKVQYLDETNTLKTLEADGLLSDCIQHEIDHLDGILFIDHLSSMKRTLLTNKAKKVVAHRLRV